MIPCKSKAHVGIGATVGADLRVGPEPRAHIQVRSYRTNAMAGIVPTPYLWLLFILALNMAGCVTQRAVLVNERGEEMTCETTASGIFPSLVIGSKQQECISEAESRGYRVKEQTTKDAPSP